MSTQLLFKRDSFNNLSGDLPNSIGLLTNLSSLNIANNHFTGWIPQKFFSISNLVLDGNLFENGSAPLPPPYTQPPPHKPHKHHNRNEGPANAPKGDDGQKLNTDERNSRKRLTAGPIVGIISGSVIVALFAILAALFCLLKFTKKRSKNQNKSSFPLGSPSAGANKGEWHQLSDLISSHAPTEWNSQTREPPISSYGQSRSAQLKPPPSEKIDKTSGKVGSARRPRIPITATYYSVASLQTATNSFGQDNLIGEGSIGRVYRAEFSNGKILVVKKLDSAALSLEEDEDFLDAVSKMSHLRHPNITTLLGYCAEHGHHLLVYEYIGNRALHDILHFSDESRILSWNAGVKVALGTARAVEYLSSIICSFCQPARNPFWSTLL